MRLVVRAAEALGAEKLIPITRAHVDSCLYHGEATIDFVERLVSGGAQVSVPTTLNVGALDLLHPELWRGDAVTAERGRLLMGHYRTLGCQPTYTCAPYQLPFARPALGEQVAWAESNAIVFCNSVLGARTERYGDFTDIACAVTGRAPDAGLHRTDARRAVLLLRLAADVPAALRDDDAFYPVLGIVLGRRAGSRVAAIDGLPPRVSEDRLKAIGAAAASSGAVAMFHAIGSTPEAPTLEVALQGGEPEETIEVTLAELRAARDELTTATGGAPPGTPIGSVSVGTPHASLVELRAVERELGGARPAPGVELLVSTGRHLLADAEEEGLARRLRVARGRAAGRHLQLHRSGPAPEPAARHDRLGQVGLLRPGQHRPGGRLRQPARMRALRGRGAGLAGCGPVGVSVRGRLLAPGSADGRALVLTEPLSLWGGVDPATGVVIDARHPQRGASTAGRVLVMRAVRGSSSSSSILAETVRAGCAPAAILLGEADLILAVGAAVAEELYGRRVPVVQLAPGDLSAIADGALVSVADGEVSLR